MSWVLESWLNSFAVPAVVELYARDAVDVRPVMTTAVPPAVGPDNRGHLPVVVVAVGHRRVVIAGRRNASTPHLTLHDVALMVCDAPMPDREATLIAGSVVPLATGLASDAGYVQLNVCPVTRQLVQPAPLEIAVGTRPVG